MEAPISLAASGSVVRSAGLGGAGQQIWGSKNWDFPQRERMFDGKMKEKSIQHNLCKWWHHLQLGFSLHEWMSMLRGITHSAVLLPQSSCVRALPLRWTVHAAIWKICWRRWKRQMLLFSTRWLPAPCWCLKSLWPPSGVCYIKVIKRECSAQTHIHANLQIHLFPWVLLLAWSCSYVKKHLSNKENAPGGCPNVLSIDWLNGRFVNNTWWIHIMQ